jgi:hypothetical protein
MSWSDAAREAALAARKRKGNPAARQRLANVLSYYRLAKRVYAPQAMSYLTKRAAVIRKQGAIPKSSRVKI